MPWEKSPTLLQKENTPLRLAEIKFITPCHLHAIQQMMDVMVKLCSIMTSCVYQRALSSSIAFICYALHSYFNGDIS